MAALTLYLQAYFKMASDRGARASSIVTGRLNGRRQAIRDNLADQPILVPP